MVYQIILGLLSVIFGYFIYTESGLEDPIKTLAAAIFFSLAAFAFLDNATEGVENDD